MGNYTNIKDLFTGICDSIREKTGETELINHQDIPEKILSIEGSEGSISKVAITDATYLFYQNYIREYYEISDFSNCENFNYFCGSEYDRKDYKMMNEILNLENAVRLQAAFYSFGSDVAEETDIIEQINLPKCLNARQMLQYSGVYKIGNIYLPLAQDVYQMLRDCTKIVEIGDIYIPSALNFGYLLYNCPNIEKIGTITFGPGGTNSNDIINPLYSLKKITELTVDTQRCVKMNTGFFPYGTSCKLKKITFINSNYDDKTNNKNIYIGNCSFGYEDLLELFNNLPDVSDVSATSTLTITGNPGASSLTDDDLKIATDKGYTVTK